MFPDNTTRENSKLIKQTASNASLELFTAALVKKCSANRDTMLWKLIAYKYVR